MTEVPQPGPTRRGLCTCTRLPANPCTNPATAEDLLCGTCRGTCNAVTWPIARGEGPATATWGRPGAHMHITGLTIGPA